MNEKKIYSLDRFEGDLAVCISDDDNVVRVNRETLGLAENDVFSAIYDGVGLSDIIPMPEERDRRLADLDARLYALVRRSKNNSEGKK